MGEVRFHRLFAPQIAAPPGQDPSYVSVPPSPPLRPYLRCFWGSAVDFDPHRAPFYADTLIVPDACCDLLLMRDNRSGRIERMFVALSDRSQVDSWDAGCTDISVFGIRLYFWTLGFLPSFSFAGTLNQVLPPCELFPALEEFSERLFARNGFRERMRLAEAYFSPLLDPHRAPAAFLECVDLMLCRRGVGALEDLVERAHYSGRQLQRLFLHTVGVPPKHLMNLIRYQCLWQQMLRAGRLDYPDAVAAYGYTDQSHLIADFKKYHSLTPTAALERGRTGGR